jgi:hypothetical protein
MLKLRYSPFIVLVSAVLLATSGAVAARDWQSVFKSGELLESCLQLLHD